MKPVFVVPRSRYNIKRYVILTAIVWTAVLVSSCWWDIATSVHETIEVARIQALESFKRDVLYRQWNTDHGGVYVAVSSDVEPNPFLAQILERDVVTPSGRTLTLINPAYMSRQVYRLGEKEFGLRSRITSANPINPDNGPDPWEAAALRDLEHDGVVERSSIEMIDGVEYMRFMRPLRVEKECLGCHESGAYREGGIAGGISVTVPMSPLWASWRRYAWGDILGFGAAWALGLAGIFVAGGRLGRSERERVMAEEDLRWHKKDLERTVDERTRELTDMVGTLEEEVAERKRAEEEGKRLQAQLLQAQKMEAVGRFAGGIAHDINNMQTAVKSFCQLGMKRLKESDPLYEFFDQAAMASDRSTAMVRQLLIFSRLEPAVRTALDVNRTINEILKMLARLIGEDITLCAELGDSVRHIHADRGKIGQIVTNLVVNASEAMPEGGKIVIRTENTTHHRCDDSIFDCTPGRYVCISVADTGVGMAGDVIGRIFEPFFTTGKGPGTGSGLGLSVAYGIVVEHGGCINVISEPGQGSCFEVFLPVTGVKEKEADGAGEDGRQSMARGRGAGVLLVEDEAIVRLAARKVLEKQGYRVTEAAGVAEALEAFGNLAQKPGIVVSDFGLPDGDGVRLIDELRKAAPGIKAILVSGYQDTDLDVESLEGTGISFVSKPYDVENLLSTISKLLKKT